MTPYINNLETIEKNYNEQISNKIIADFVAQSTTEGLFGVINIIKQLGKNLGRIAYGMESRTFPNYPDFEPNININQSFIIQIAPLMVIATNEDFLNLIEQTQPLKIVDIMDSAGLAIAYCINTNQVNTDNYPKNDFDIQSIFDTYIKILLDKAKSIILSGFGNIDEKLKISDSVSKLIARISYGVENQFQDKNQDLNGVGTYGK